LAVAVLGAVAAAVFSASVDRRTQALGLPADVRHELRAAASSLGGIEVPAAIASAERQRVEQAIGDSFVASFRVAMLIAAACALSSAACAASTIGPRASARR